MKLTKETTMPTVVLGSICLIVAVLLALVNSLTKPVIDEATAARQQASLKQVYQNTEEYKDVDVTFEEVTVEKTRDTVTGVYKASGDLGYVCLVSTKSQYTTSGADLAFTVAVSPDGRIVNVEVTNYKETKDFGNYPSLYKGVAGGDVGTVPVKIEAGATYSCTAFRDGLKDVFDVLTENGLIGGGEQ